MELANKSDDEILAVANPIMDNLMEGSTDINHEKHTRDFTDRLKYIVTKDHFEKICKHYQSELGYFSKREFVAVFRRPSSIAIVWKQWCTKQEGEFVAEIVLVEKNSRYLVEPCHGLLIRLCGHRIPNRQPNSLSPLSFMLYKTEGNTRPLYDLFY